MKFEFDVEVCKNVSLVIYNTNKFITRLEFEKSEEVDELIEMLHI